MKATKSFRFSDPRMQRELISRLKRSAVKFALDRDGTVRYPREETDRIENEIICRIRSEAFDRWQVLTCPTDWLARYRQYMARRAIPYREEVSDGQTWFLLSRERRPHQWSIEAEKPAHAPRAVARRTRRG